jgi:uridine kinase
MLARRLRRDVQERGRSVDGVLEQYVQCCADHTVPQSYQTLRYLRFVKPSYDNFVSPTSRFADIVSCHKRLCLFVDSSILPADRPWLRQQRGN